MIYTNDFSRRFEFDLYRLCENSPYGARIVSYHTAYHGKKYDFLDFWLQRNNQGKAVCAFCKYYSTLIICGTPCDYSEIVSFIEMLSPLNVITDNSFNLNESYVKITGETMQCSKILYSAKLPSSEDSIYKVESNMRNLKTVYDILCAENDDTEMLPDFESYFLDMSHRIRHGTARVYVVTNKFGEAVSTASVLASSKTAAVVGCVATDYDNRNRGYASALVAYVTGKELSQNRTVFLHREKQISVYEKIGFKTIGSWTEYRHVKK